jgi:hypothetical protein
MSDDAVEKAVSTFEGRRVHLIEKKSWVVHISTHISGIDGFCATIGLWRYCFPETKSPTMAHVKVVMVVAKLIRRYDTIRFSSRLSYTMH